MEDKGYSERQLQVKDTLHLDEQRQQLQQTSYQKLCKPEDSGVAFLQLKEKNCQPRIPYPAKPFFKNEEKIQILGKQKLEEFTSSKPELQELLKEVLWADKHDTRQNLESTQRNGEH